MTDKERSDVEKSMSLLNQSISEGLGEYMEQLQKDAERTKAFEKQLKKEHQEKEIEDFLLCLVAALFILGVIAICPVIFVIFVVAFLIHSIR